MKHLSFLLKMSAITLTTALLVDINITNASTNSGEGFNFYGSATRKDYVAKPFRKVNNNQSGIKLAVNLDEFGKTVGNAFDNNIGTVATVVEANPEQYASALVDNVYWGRSEKYKGSIACMKWMFTTHWSDSSNQGDYVETVNRNVNNISNLVNMASLKVLSSETDVTRWAEDDIRRKILANVMGLFALRTVNNIRNIRSDRTILTPEMLNEVFANVLNITKQDSYYKDIIKYFNSEAQFDIYIKHDWNCYFNQFCVLMDGEIAGNQIKSVVNQIEENIKNVPPLKTETPLEKPNNVDRVGPDTTTRPHINDNTLNRNLENLEQDMDNYLKQTDNFLKKYGFTQSISVLVKNEIDDLKKQIIDKKSDEYEQKCLMRTLKNIRNGLTFIKNQQVSPDKFAKDFMLVKCFAEENLKKEDQTLYELIGTVCKINSSYYEDDPLGWCVLPHIKDESGFCKIWCKLILASMLLRDEKVIASSLQVDESKISLSSSFNSKLKTMYDPVVKKIVPCKRGGSAYLTMEKFIDFLKEMARAFKETEIDSSFISNCCDAFVNAKKISFAYNVESFVAVADLLNKPKGDMKDFLKFLNNIFEKASGEVSESISILFGLHHKYGEKVKTISGYIDYLDDYIEKHDKVGAREKCWRYLCDTVNDIIEKSKLKEVKSKRNLFRSQKEAMRNFNVSVADLKENSKINEIFTGDWRDKFKVNVARGAKSFKNNLDRSYTKILAEKDALEEIKTLYAEGSYDLPEIIGKIVEDLMREMPRFYSSPYISLEELDTEAESIKNKLNCIYIDSHPNFPSSITDNDCKEVEQYSFDALHKFCNMINDKKDSWHTLSSYSQPVTSIIENLTCCVSEPLKPSFVKDILEFIVNDPSFASNAVQCVYDYQYTSEFLFRRNISGTLDELLKLAQKLAELYKDEYGRFSSNLACKGIEDWRYYDNQYVNEYFYSKLKS